MLRRIVPNRKSLRAFAVAGAWFFIVVSLGHLVWAGMNAAYRPGVGTAVLFLILVPLLIREVLSSRPRPETG